MNTPLELLITGRIAKTHSLGVLWRARCTARTVEMSSARNDPRWATRTAPARSAWPRASSRSTSSPRGEQGVRPVPLAPSPRPARAPAAPRGRSRHTRRPGPQRPGEAGTSVCPAHHEPHRPTGGRARPTLAVESDPARRRKLVDDHNAKIRRLNIRYRRSAQRERRAALAFSRPRAGRRFRAARRA